MTRTTRWLALACAAIWLATATRASAEVRVGGSAGIVSAFGQTYFSLGGHLGYVLPLGLEPNLELQWWIGASPRVWKLAPGVNWFLPLPLPSLRPYVGAYYAHWFVSEGFPDADAIGARGGVMLLSTGPAAVGIGIAYEHALSCSANCDSWIPEATVAVTF